MNYFLSLWMKPKIENMLCDSDKVQKCSYY